MISLDDFHAGESCWCGPVIEKVRANDGHTRNLIIHNAADIRLDPQDPADIEIIVLMAQMTLDGIETELAKWWAVIEYAKLGA